MNWIGSRWDAYRDSEGHFSRSAKVDDDKARLYIPWTVVETSKKKNSSRDLLVLIAIEKEATKASVVERYEIDIPLKSPFSELDFFRPFIGLALAVAYSVNIRFLFKS